MAAARNAIIGTRSVTAIGVILVGGTRLRSVLTELSVEFATAKHSPI